MSSQSFIHSDVFDSRQAWARLAVSVVLSTVGGIGLWSVVVALPVIETEFGIDRGAASLPYFVTLVGAALGGVFMGRLADRFGITVPLIVGAVMLCLGYFAAAMAQNLWQYLVAQALLIGAFGSSVTFGPLVADVSLWFVKRRGIAVAIVSSGNYLAGTVWPPFLQYGFETAGWRTTHMVVGVVCIVAMVPLALLLRRRAPLEEPASAPGSRAGVATAGGSGMSPRAVQVLLMIAGLACCIAMAMPQVHMVAYCGDLGYGAQHGAQLLSLMLGFGVVSRLLSGLIADKIGGLGTLILGSTLQCLALVFYLPFDGLASLYIVSILFGLAQGGIVPSYTLVVRDYFPAREAAERISLVIMATVFGMAVGGWMSGEIYDLTGSYQAAFLNGIAWNLLNMSIAAWFLFGRVRAARAVV